MLKWAITGVWMAIVSIGLSQDRSVYIETYKDIAISEMMRTGIPASIKLAQAILESSCGKSDLACKANNHFGIKCGNDWKGKSYKKEDDDYEDGKLVKSCFREFPSVWDSYLAHSDFLTDPNKSHRYGFLFRLEATDYKGWAKGLSKAGYATDPQYADRLIDIIEKNKLFMYDVPLPEAYSSNDRQKHKDKSERKHTRTHFATARYHNDVKYDIAKAGDTPESVAQRNDVTPGQVVRYNDDIEDASQPLAEGSRVYLQPKRNQNNGTQKMHLLKPGENLVMVSQQYGIRLEALLKRNGLQPGELPAPNQKILLKGKSKNKLRTVNPYAPPSVPPVEKNDEEEVVSVKNEIPVKPKETKPDTSKKTNTSMASAPVINKPAQPTASAAKTTQSQNETAHIVTKGDTLYSVSRIYGVQVAELKKANNLSVDTIFIGQKLLLP